MYFILLVALRLVCFFLARIVAATRFCSLSASYSMRPAMRIRNFIGCATKGRIRGKKFCVRLVVSQMELLFFFHFSHSFRLAAEEQMYLHQTRWTSLYYSRQLASASVFVLHNNKKRNHSGLLGAAVIVRMPTIIHFGPNERKLRCEPSEERMIALQSERDYTTTVCVCRSNQFSPMYFCRMCCKCMCVSLCCLL